MPDTIQSIEIPSEWVSVNSLTGLAVGTPLLIQNVGGAKEIIEYAISATVPSDGLIAPQAKSLDWVEVTTGENEVWARLANKNALQNNTGKINVQEVV